MNLGEFSFGPQDTDGDTDEDTDGSQYQYLCGGTLELQQYHGTGTLHDVEVEQQRFVSVEQRKRVRVTLWTWGCPGGGAAESHVTFCKVLLNKPPCQLTPLSPSVASISGLSLVLQGVNI